MLFDFHLVSLETSGSTGKEKFTLGLKMRLKMKPFDSGYIIHLKDVGKSSKAENEGKRKRKCLRTVQLND